MAIAGAHEDYGVVVAEINLKFMWDVVSEIKASLQDTLFVVDTGGRLIAHPDISLVLRNIDLSQFAYVRAALTRSVVRLGDNSLNEGVQNTQSPMHAPVPSLGWTLIVCRPMNLTRRSSLPFCTPTDPASRPHSAAKTWKRFASNEAQGGVVVAPASQSRRTSASTRRMN
jgi:hypothetical protein